jgi:hypothetical protein
MAWPLVHGTAQHGTAQHSSTMASSLFAELVPSCLALCVMLRRWASLTAAAKKAYELRYKLLTYFYSSMYLAHKKGGTLARPIFFNDPSDLKARCAHPQAVQTAHSYLRPRTSASCRTQ